MLIQQEDQPTLDMFNFLETTLRNVALRIWQKKKKKNKPSSDKRGKSLRK